jgi:hypothetical protein
MSSLTPPPQRRIVEYMPKETANDKKIPKTAPPLIQVHGRDKIKLWDKEYRIDKPTIEHVKAWCVLYGPPMFPPRVMAQLSGNGAQEIRADINAEIHRIFSVDKWWRDVHPSARESMWTALAHKYPFFDHFDGKWMFWKLVGTLWQKRRDNKIAKARQDRATIGLFFAILTLHVY